MLRANVQPVIAAPAEQSKIEDPQSKIPEVLDDLRAGRMIVLTDDEGRENEGDLVCAAEHATPAVINFMLTHGRGMLFVALDGPTCDRLGLPPAAAVNTTQRGTNYTVSVDATARFGVTTGVSASDRSVTIRRLAEADAVAADFDRPGHVQPLRARPGGVLVRTGHTEGMVDLMRLAGLRPAAVGIEIMNADGTMARRPEVEALCAAHGIKLCSIADLIEHRVQRDRLVRRVDEAAFTNELGTWRLIAFESAVDALPHVALVCGDVGRVGDDGQPLEIDEPVLVRMHSQNLLGDVFGDVTQPSGDTLRQAMRTIQRHGRGVVVYLRHEGMGRGVLKRLQTMKRDAEQPEPTDGARIGQRHETPGTAPPPHKMDYGIGCQVLRGLGLRKLRLLTNHPFTPSALSGFGLEIAEFVAVDGDAHG